MRLPSALHTPSSVTRSIGLVVLAMFCFAVVDALGKVVALRYPANEVTFFRMAFGLVPAVLFCMRGDQPPLRARLRRLDVRGQSIRAVTLLGASALFFAGLPYLPLSEAVSIVYSEALFVIVLAPLLLKERFLPRNLAAAGVGFIGVLLVVRPQGNHSSALGAVLLLGSAICGALSVMQIRRIRPGDDSRMTVLFFTTVGTVVTGASLLFAWRAPSFGDLIVFAMLGMAATVAQLLFTLAVRSADAAMLAPWSYTSIVWATLFGYVFWGETVAWLTAFGIVLIVGSSIATAIREEPPEGPAL